MPLRNFALGLAAVGWLAALSPSAAPRPPTALPCAALPVWPIPQRCAATPAAADEAPCRLDGNFSIEYAGPSLRLRRAVRRYSTILRYAVRNASAAGPLKTLRLIVADEAD
jgi:hypothetical protein